MKISIGDVRLYVDVEGAQLVVNGMQMRERPTVLLLHGGPGYDHTHFKPAYSQLTDLAQVIYYDHRGNGRSDPSTPDKWNLQTWADDLHRLIQVLGLEKPIVMGGSFGASVAQQFATTYPDAYSKLILFAAVAHYDFENLIEVFEQRGGPEIAAIAREHLYRPSEKTWEGFYSRCLPYYGKSGWDEAISARAIVRPEVIKVWGRSDFRSLDFRPALQRIHAPTLLFAGKLDPITPHKSALEMAACFRPGVLQLEVFDDCSHNIDRDDPERFFRRVREFILA
jgi:proline iminopeptidase